MKRFLSSVCLMLCVLTSCKKEKRQDLPGVPSPVVDKIMPLTAQTGDTITIEGANFSERAGKNELAINGIPAKVISANASQIRAIIPAFCQTGNILLTVTDVSIKGPVINIIPSPDIRSIFPEYGFAGDTLTITGEHFALNKADNTIVLNGVKIPVVKQQADTLLKVIVPTGDGNGKLIFSIYNGRKKEYSRKFGLRRPYSGNLMESIRQDPGFTYINAIMERMKEVYPAYYDKINSIWTGVTPHTVFLYDNDNLRKTNRLFTSVDYVRNNVDPQVFYYQFMMQTAQGLWYKNQLQTGTYPSVLSEEDAWGGPGSGGNPDVFTPIFVMRSADGLFMRLSEENDPTTVVKTDLKATNGIIHQLGFN